jgi:hypothetical protein
MLGQLQKHRTCVLSRLGAMESISSMKMMEGAFFSASWNTLRRLDSDSPAAGHVPVCPKSESHGSIQLNQCIQAYSLYNECTHTGNGFMCTATEMILLW